MGTSFQNNTSSKRSQYLDLTGVFDTYSHVVGGLQESVARKFDDFIGAKNQSVSKVPKSKVGVRGFEPPAP